MVAQASGMLNKIAIVAALVLATGCGASRPQRSTQTRQEVMRNWVDGDNCQQLQTKFQLESCDEARDLVRVSLIELNRRYVREH